MSANCHTIDQNDENETNCHSGSVKQSKHFPEFWALVFAAGSLVTGMPGMFGLEPNTYFPWISLGSSLVVTLVFGWRFWLGIPQLFYRPNMNSLVGLGVAAAYGLSIWKWLGEGETSGLYFDSAAFVVAFVLLGHWIERKMRQKITDSLPRFANVLPAKTHRLSEGGEMQDVALSEIRQDDRIRVLAGERVPVDAELVSEVASFDQSLLTGESKPVTMKKHSLVVQGSLNLDQPIELIAKSKNSESFYKRLIEETQKTLLQRPDFQKTVDRWASILVPLVVLISLGTAGYWYFVAQNVSVMMTAAISVLVIACPCALGLATPLAYFVAVRRANQLGIFIKNLNAIEKSSEVSVIAFDKTGTLTEGQPKVASVFSIENISHNDVLQMAHCLEQYSEHPYGRAINNAAQAEGLKAFETRDILVQSGKGLKATVVKDNKAMEVCVGNLNWLFENGYEVTDLPEKLRWEAEGSEATVVWVAVDKKIMGIITLADPMRSGASEMIEALKDEGYEVGLITGDSENVARLVAKNLQLNFFHYGVAPSEKATIIRRLSEKKKKGLDFITPRIAFIGDGINDGPALAGAHLGIAMGSGAALAQSSADLVLSTNSLESVEKAFSTMRSASWLIRQNLILAFVYNIVAIPIAAGVLYPFFGILLGPAVAAAAMSLSSLSVVLNSLRALRR